MPGEQNGAVYKITIGRADFTIKEMGATINARMGLNTWAAFYGNDADAVVAGDVAMLDRRYAGAEGAARQRHRRRRDPPSHDRDRSRPSSSCTTGERDRPLLSRPLCVRPSTSCQSPLCADAVRSEDASLQRKAVVRHMRSDGR